MFQDVEADELFLKEYDIYLSAVPDGLMAFLLLGTAAAIGAFIYLKKTKDTKKPTDDYDPDADYDESEENYLDSLPENLDDDFEVINDEEDE